MQHKSQIRRIGIVSGVKEELAAFLPGAERQTITACGLAVQKTGLGDKEIHLLCTGIGKVAAATGAALLKACFDVDLLMVIGTAAKIGRLEGDVFNITQAVQGDFGAQREIGLVHYTAGSWPIGPAEVRAFEALHVSGVDLPKAKIATNDLFIEYADHAQALSDKLGVHLIDMETAAVAQAASILGLPWLAIKATTDSADEDSAGSFVENLQAAANASARAAEQAIALL